METQTPSPIQDQTSTAFGTFCVAINRQLVVSNCPLPKGACIWKHNVTGQCKASARHAEMTAAELCKVVGQPVPTEAEITALHEELKTSIRRELKV